MPQFSSHYVNLNWSSWRVKVFSVLPNHNVGDISDTISVLVVLSWDMMVLCFHGPATLFVFSSFDISWTLRLKWAAGYKSDVMAEQGRHCRLFPLILGHKAITFPLILGRKAIFSLILGHKAIFSLILGHKPKTYTLERHLYLLHVGKFSPVWKVFYNSLCQLFSRFELQLQYKHKI